jgi:hypothetical protein
MHLHADDGTELQVKEGIVLDSAEQTILYEGDTASEERFRSGIFGSRQSSVRVFRLGLWTLPVIALGIILTFVLGTFLFTVVAAIFFIFFVARSLTSIFRFKL